MPDEHTLLPATATKEQQSQTIPMSPHRLDTPRERIDAVCTEYNNFNSSCFVTVPSSTISCAGAEYERRFRSPDPGQLRIDLQALFERFLTLDSDAADNAYRRISLRAWETASDEYGTFDWNKLKKMIGDEVEAMTEHGCYLDLSDLVTLRTTATCSV
ncbi:hypothetical protein Q7P35_003001 [Cladosporium inversicolor]